MIIFKIIYLIFIYDWEIKIIKYLTKINKLDFQDN
jgi:hypothetical protein